MKSRVRETDKEMGRIEKKMVKTTISLNEMMPAPESSGGIVIIDAYADLHEQ